MVKQLNVFQNGELVGVLAKGSAGALSFQYAASWLESPQMRPISFSLPLHFKPLSGPAVYSFFENLLPDTIFDQSKIRAHFPLLSGNPFDMLEAIGKDCVGAFQFAMSGQRPPDPFKIEAEPLTEAQIATYLRSLNAFPLADFPDEEFRISLAGAQEKTGFLYRDERWCRPLGATPTSHIFKTPIPHLPLSCEAEWLTMQYLDRLGIPVAKTSVQQFEDQKALIVERFDRRLSKDGSKIMRLPMEDLCQALGYPSSQKYESDGGPGIEKIASFLAGDVDSEQDVQTFFKVQILFWLLGAIDGHAKNFSVFIHRQGLRNLTPLRVTCTNLYKTSYSLSLQQDNPRVYSLGFKSSFNESWL